MTGSLRTVPDTLSEPRHPPGDDTQKLALLPTAVELPVMERPEPVMVTVEVEETPPELNWVELACSVPCHSEQA